MISKNESLGWVREYFPDAPELSASVVTNHPWACTQRVVVGTDIYYLKEVRNNAKPSSDYLSTLSAMAHPRVPKLLNSSASRNLYLYSDFDADVFDGKLPSEDRLAALKVYAGIQVESFANKSFEAQLPHISCEGAFNQFLDLLEDAVQQKDSNGREGNPFLYMSKGSVRDYHSLFKTIAPELMKLLAAADTAPRVINHCDLRPKNIAKKQTGEIVIFDWDDAVWGPPGLSLHAQFSGCSKIVHALNSNETWSSGRSIEHKRVLEAYINCLRQHSGFEKVDLNQNLTASAIAGVFYYIAGFAPYSVSSSTSRASIKKNVRRRISDLLTGLELLAATNKPFRKALRTAYSRSGRSERVKALSSAGTLDTKSAIKAYPMPADASYDIKDFGVSRLSEDQVNRATSAYHENGCLVLRDIIDPKLIQDCRSSFFEKLEDHDTAISKGEALRVGDKRYMLSPSLEGAFCNPKVLAAKPLMQILGGLLGKGFVLGSFTAVASAPGAAEQKIHRDLPLLFPEKGHLDIPSFCISVIIPLVDVNAQTGTTRLWPGSHLKGSKYVEQITPADPYVDTGGCYLMDSAVFHQGLANVSDTIRPILCLVFQRPWYRDHKNFNYQNTVNLGQDAKDQLHPDVAQLVSWVKVT